MKAKIAALVCAALVVAGCSGDSQPGERSEARIARPTWDTGHMQAEIYRLLLEELGYTVNDPAEREMTTEDVHEALAAGELDFWASGWFPDAQALIDEAGVQDEIAGAGMLMRSGGLQGVLMDKASFDLLGITTLDEIANSPETAALFDIDGDGRADLMGCNEDWACRAVLDDTIALNGWEDTIEQVSGNHDQLFEQSIERHRAGEPVLQYAWTPGPFTARLRPGIDVILLGVAQPLKGQDGISHIPSEICPSQPCRTGFSPSDIRVVANRQFLEDNPAAASLIESAAVPEADISAFSLAYQAGAEPTDGAAQWIADNRELVDAWLKKARQ